MLETAAFDAPLSYPTVGASVQLSWVSSIREVGPVAWMRCFDVKDVLQAYDLHAAVEAAQLDGLELRYLIARRSGEVVAIIPCFRIRVSLTVVSHDSIARLVNRVRRLWPGFLYLNTFVIGTPIAICRDLLGFHLSLSRSARGELMAILLPEIIRTARRCNAGLVLLKEMSSHCLEEWRAVLERHFVIVEGPATSYLYLGEPGASSYRDRLRKKYRSLMNNRQAKLTNAGMHWEVCSDFSKYAEQMHNLYMQVLTHSKIRFETLTPQFFACLPAHLSQRVFALLCFRGDELTAFELFVADAHWIHPIYLGMDYRYRDEAALYFNGIYKIVEVLESHGKSVVQLGQTSYDAKASIGAVIDRLYLAAHHTRPIIHRLLRRFATLVFPPTRIPRAQRVFRDMQANDDGLAAHGIQFERTEVRGFE